MYLFLNRLVHCRRYGINRLVVFIVDHDASPVWFRTNDATVGTNDSCHFFDDTAGMLNMLKHSIRSRLVKPVIPEPHFMSVFHDIRDIARSLSQAGLRL